ncbi:uncharacterized protein LOC110814398 [Carica papaya]|uniref:uncharacterized protein LOC110814398 n=1 Tax=Carica papaya TaxID=3649 RepID=UPI000B8CA730|nr:uncharacterized protein LOC110814398 [Carica papaya]
MKGVEHKFFLVGRLHTERSFNAEALIEMMRLMWKPIGKFEGILWAKQLILFQFSNEKDLHRVQRGAPWLFEQAVLCLKQIQGNEYPNSITCIQTEIWGRIYALPPKFMTESVARRCGIKMGHVITVDNTTINRLSPFLRVRVAIDVTKPIPRGTFIKVIGSQFWVPFRYERLPPFCFYCGCLGHTRRLCSLWDESNEGEMSKTHYSDDLRVSTFGVNRVTISSKVQYGDFECTEKLMGVTEGNHQGIVNEITHEGKEEGQSKNPDFFAIASQKIKEVMLNSVESSKEGKEQLQESRSEKGDGLSRNEPNQVNNQVQDPCINESFVELLKAQSNMGLSKALPNEGLPSNDNLVHDAQCMKNNLGMCSSSTIGEGLTSHFLVDSGTQLVEKTIAAVVSSQKRRGWRRKERNNGTTESSSGSELGKLVIEKSGGLEIDGDEEINDESARKKRLKNS